MNFFDQRKAHFLHKFLVCPFFSWLNFYFRGQRGAYNQFLHISDKIFCWSTLANCTASELSVHV